MIRRKSLPNISIIPKATSLITCFLIMGRFGGVPGNDLACAIFLLSGMEDGDKQSMAFLCAVSTYSPGYVPYFG